MRTYFIFVIIILTGLSRCGKEQINQSDTRLINDFNERIVRIENLNVNEGVGGREFVDVASLSILTGIKSNLSFGDVTVYSSKKDIIKDVKEWQTWFDDNHIHLSSDTLEVIDSIFLLNNDWISID